MMEMEIFKNWLNEQNVSVQAMKSILDDLNIIKHDFCKKKLYRYLFVVIETNDILEIIRTLKSDKLYMMKNYISKNRLNRSLDMYLKFVQHDRNFSRKDEQTSNIRLTQDNSTIVSQNLNEAKYKKALQEYFSNGFRLNSSIELKKFKRRFCEITENELKDDEKKIIETIKKMGMEYEGKIYLTEQMMDTSTAEQVIMYIHKIFGEGKKNIYYDSLFQRFKDDFQGFCMYNENMLKSYLAFINDGGYYIKRSYISADENNDIEPIDEIRKCMIENGGIYSYNEIAKLLPYISIEKIKIILRRNSELVRNQKGSYFHADIIDLTEEEIRNITNIIEESINNKGYISGKEMYNKIKENCLSGYEKMSAFSESGIRNAIAYKLREKFSYNGNVISKIGESLSTADIYAYFCRSRDEFTLDDLCELRDELGSGVIYFEPVYLNSLRISEMEFVSKKYAQFNTSAIDRIINKFCVSEYITIKEITQFSIFPTEKFRWNNYLLEHYIYEHSNQYKLLNRGFNASKCIGVIVKKTSSFTEYDDVLADAIANSSIDLNCEDALDYLYKNGYIGRRMSSNIDIIIGKAKNIRIKKGQ